MRYSPSRSSLARRVLRLGFLPLSVIAVADRPRRSCPVLSRLVPIQVPMCRPPMRVISRAARLSTRETRPYGHRSLPPPPWSRRPTIRIPPMQPGASLGCRGSAARPFCLPNDRHQLFDREPRSPRLDHAVAVTICGSFMALLWQPDRWARVYAPSRQVETEETVHR